MKKVLTLALSAALLLAMSIPAFADSANLGNYVLSVDELEAEEEAPAEEAAPSQKENPNTGAFLGNYVLSVDELEAEEDTTPSESTPAENPNTGVSNSASALLAAGSLAAALALLRRR